MPSTIRVAHFHVRVFLQTTQCSGLKLLKTDLDVAPEDVLKFIRCKCKFKSLTDVAQTYVPVSNMEYVALKHGEHVIE